jgi:hypothetical protein
MAQAAFADLKGPLSRALLAVAHRGPAGALAPVWAEAVGALASRSRPVRLSGASLTVEVDPEFIDDLLRAQEALRQRLNDRLGKDAVRRITFVAWPRSSPA